MTNPADVFTNELEKPEFYNTAPYKIFPRSNFKIYPICKLPELIEIIRRKKTHSLRFLVDKNNHCWFALEGPRSSRIPGHAQMTGSVPNSAKCTTAGDVVFSEDYRHIVRINHKSGGFTPSFDSLKWALAILALNPQALFASELQVEELDSNGGTKALHTFSVDDLQKWILATFTQELLESFIANQPEDIKTYTPSAERVYSLFRAKRQLEFTNDSDEEGNGLPSALVTASDEEDNRLPSALVEQRKRTFSESIEGEEGDDIEGISPLFRH